jgi:threonine synthase
MENYSYISHVECPKCGEHYEEDKINQLCTCGSPLLARYDLEKVKANVSREFFATRKNSLWRYHELLPIHNEKNIVTLGEGMTPLEKLPTLGAAYGLTNLYIKDEGVLPTGSFKTRGASVGISKAKELGVFHLAMPTNGNAGAAWALYATKANIKATIVMPVDAPEITRKEVYIAGGELYLINGLISDAGRTVSNFIQQNGIYDASTLKEPYRIEGKKTMGYEIVEQFGWKVPDVILYPTGGGVGIIGIYKALLELKQLGWIDNGKLPRLVAVQAEGCAPIVEAWKNGEKESRFFKNSTTSAFGINVPKALGDFLVLEAIYRTNGCAVAVSENDLIEAQRQVASLEGNFICPEGAATFAAARILREQGWLQSDEIVVCLNTGSGLKYPETVQIQEIKTLLPGQEI